MMNIIYDILLPPSEIDQYFLLQKVDEPFQKFNIHPHSWQSVAMLQSLSQAYYYYYYSI